MALYLDSTLKILQSTFMSASVSKEPESGNFVQLEVCDVVLWGGPGLPASSDLLPPESPVYSWAGPDKCRSRNILSLRVCGAFLRGALVVAGFG